MEQENNIPTALGLLSEAETFDLEYPTISINDAVKAMQEFAQFHVEAALKAVKEKAHICIRTYDEDGEVKFEGDLGQEICTPEGGRDYYGIEYSTILTAYPKENIK